MIQTTGDNAKCSDYIAHESGVVTFNSRGIVRDMVSMKIKKLVWHGMDSEEGKDQLVVKHLVKQGEDMKRCDHGPGGVCGASDTRPHPQRNGMYYSYLPLLSYGIHTHYICM
ncbi:hypothetical protein PF002_g29493 [Phytophthora fragariae]|uniref:Uncharacterized protein n=1 Tax=Phytophthora fragariae TaxID=53985 RepID=A0A6A4BDU3_9STRA|nr:hypothetical protein PF002_g29493 [Phytophthora fragariae]KAE9271522.1 hypothetical protein PF001_g28340 [Phytophthora fragariae]